MPSTGVSTRLCLELSPTWQRLSQWSTRRLPCQPELAPTSRYVHIVWGWTVCVYWLSAWIGEHMVLFNSKFVELFIGTHTYIHMYVHTYVHTCIQSAGSSSGCLMVRYHLLPVLLISVSGSMWWACKSAPFALLCSLTSGFCCAYLIFIPENLVRIFSTVPPFSELTKWVWVVGVGSVSAYVCLSVLWTSSPDIALGNYSHD